MADTDIKTVTVTIHIDEKTGKVVNATNGNGGPGIPKGPAAGITDCKAFVVAHNSPSCVYIKIGDTLYCFGC